MLLKSSRLATALLLFGSIAFSLLALEIAARILRSTGGGGKEEGEIRVYMEYDPFTRVAEKAG